jgi:hypothetical protein
MAGFRGTEVAGMKKVIECSSPHVIESRGNIFYVSLLFLIALATMQKQVFSSAYFSINPNDSITYTRWAQEFATALNEGIWYPRWMPDEFSGYGSPTFILYSPLSFYFTSLINVFTGSIVEAMNLVKFFSLFLMSAGMFFLTSEFHPKKTSFIAAAFYAIYPFNLLQFYLFSPFASTVALVWFSPILLFVCRFIKRERYSDLIYAGFCYGGLVLTHLITAYMFAFVLVAFMALRALTKKSVTILLALPVLLTIGGLVSSAYLLPVLFEHQHLQLEAFVTKGTGFDYSTYFLLPNQMAHLPQNTFWPIHHELILVHALSIIGIALYSFLIILKHVKDHHPLNTDVFRIYSAFTIVCICTFLLMFGVTRSIWEFIPKFKYIQFPSRWLPLTVYLASLVMAYAIYASEIMISSKKLYYSLIVLIFSVIILLDINYVKRVQPFTRGELSVRADGPIEHLPVGVDVGKLRQEAHFNAVVIVEGQGKTEILSWGSATREIKIAADRPVTVRIRTLNFPGWRAYLDEARSGITSAEGSQAMLVKVPAGNHYLKLDFSDTPVRLFGKILSGCSVLSLSLFLLIDAKKEDDRGDQGPVV